MKQMGPIIVIHKTNPVQAAGSSWSTLTRFSLNFSGKNKYLTFLSADPNLTVDQLKLS